MPSLILFHRDHLKDIDLRFLDKKVVMSVPGAIDRIEMQSQSGISYTGIDDEGDIIAIGGVCMLWQGVGSGWVLTSDLMVKYKIWTHRVIRDILNKAIKVHNLHRIESIILRNHDISCKWAERLGFQCEGLLKQYDSQKNDYWLFARTI
jgi:RimJ/RimL family protein N-acetyltransferase